jgi:hypothetical protein
MIYLFLTEHYNVWFWVYVLKSHNGIVSYFCEASYSVSIYSSILTFANF